jgi:uncharacterized FlaG/YvyC family protein
MNNPVTAAFAIQPGTVPSEASRLERPAPATAVKAEQAAPEDAGSELRGLQERRSFGDRVAEFAYDDEVDRIVITIYSSFSEPREVVRQIPPEDFLAFAAKYRELLGVLFDKQA